MADNENNQWEDMEYTDNTNDEQSYSYDEQDYLEEDTDKDYESYEDNEEDASEEYNQDDDEEYEDEDYENTDEYDEDGYEEDGENQYNNKNNILIPVLIIIILIIIAGVAALLFMQSKSKSGQNAFAPNTQDEGISIEIQDDLANSFFEAAGGDESGMMSVNFNDNGDVNVLSNGADNNNAQVATVTETSPDNVVSGSDLFENGAEQTIIAAEQTNQESPLNQQEQNEAQPQETQTSQDNQENNAIMVVYNKVANLNPFKAPDKGSMEKTPYEMLNDSQFEIIEPPVKSVPDENLTRLLQTQISGILYDEDSPSAIVKLNGIDQFVKVGDVVSGYKIVNITRDKVQISYKSNSYVASVGELFTPGSLEKKAAIVNLENKFAGRYKENN